MRDWKSTDVNKLVCGANLIHAVNKCLSGHIGASAQGYWQDWIRAYEPTSPRGTQERPLIPAAYSVNIVHLDTKGLNHRSFFFVKQQQYLLQFKKKDKHISLCEQTGIDNYNKHWKKEEKKKPKLFFCQPSQFFFFL